MKARSDEGVRGRPWRVPALLALATVLGAPTAAAAQAGGPGFLFRSPVASLSVQAGYAAVSAGSDIFDDVMDDVFLDRRDLDAPYVGGSLAVRVSRRWAIVVDAGHAWSHTNTEWQAYVEDDGRPIRHSVSYSRTPVTAGLRVHLTDPGRRIGRFVWIPSRVTPYLGAGGGFVRYRFARTGDFVDEAALEIFADRLEHAGTSFTAYGTGGVEVAVGRSLFLSAEARYEWARDDLGGSVYEGFEPIDLAGLRFTAGFGVRF